MRPSFGLAIFGLAFSGLAANKTTISYVSVKPIMAAQGDRLPPALRNADDAAWQAWTLRQDTAIRARLEKGDLDSMVNFLLFGTSFTKLPRIRMESIVADSRAGTLGARVHDLVAGLISPGDNERLVFLSGRLRQLGIAPRPSNSGKLGDIIFDNLYRVVQEKINFERSAKATSGSIVIPDAADILSRRSGRFRDRGLSLDTGLFPNFSIEQALRDLQKRGLLRENQVVRVAVIGPGLDFADKNEESSYDYYPQQTLQPFFLYDSLVRLRLARDQALSVSVFDISSRLIEHLGRARQRARRNADYVVQLPYSRGPWPAGFNAYWRSAGDQIGSEVKPIQPPAVFSGMETRAMRIRSRVVLACEPVDLNIVLEHLNMPVQELFDVVVGTNIFIYYDAFERTLALENVGAMLKPGGFLLTNDELPEFSGGSMRLVGTTDVKFATQDGNRDAIVWYQKLTPR